VIAAIATSPIRTLRESRVTGGRSGPRQRDHDLDLIGAPAPARSRARSPVSPVGAHDAHTALGAVVAETQLRRSKQAIDDHVTPMHPVIDEIRRLALRSDDEQGRHCTLSDTAGELDVDFLSIVESMERTPGRVVALDGC
jgi:hypothetical protein